MTTDYTDRARSWSQLVSYEQCPRAFYLERIEKAWQRPAAWFATGLGVHTAVEHIESDPVPPTPAGALEIAKAAFRADINARLADTPNAEFWQASGPYRGPADILRRYNDLGRHLENYYRIATERLGDFWWPTAPLGHGAVEWAFEVDLDGVKVKGLADQVRRVDGETAVVDIKAGSVTPDDPGQLATYREAVKAHGGPEITKGVYVMTAKKPTKTGRLSAAQVVTKDLTVIPTEALTARFHAADEGIRAENWDPKPSAGCERCSVLSSCPDGQKFLREDRK